jgi:hypothetical protein
MSKTKPKPDIGGEWFDLADSCRAFGMTAQGFAKSVRPLIPGEDVRNGGKRGVMIRLRGAIDAYTKDRAEKLATKTDALLASGDSEALEEYRRARAELAKLDLSERQRELVPLAEVKKWIGEQVTGAKNRLLSIPARAAPLLTGRDAAESMQILDDLIREALQELSDGKLSKV